jgi:hypothetical protein
MRRGGLIIGAVRSNLHSRVGGMAGADRPAGVGGALEPVRVAALPARRVTTLVRAARPITRIASVLLVEILGSPRGRAAALAALRRLQRRLAAGRAPTRAGTRYQETVCRVTVVAESAATTMLVRRVETTLVSPIAGQPPAKR